MPPKHVAGLPTQVVNDKGRYRTQIVKLAEERFLWGLRAAQFCTILRISRALSENYRGKQSSDSGQ
jgi:hypothetical protein